MATDFRVSIGFPIMGAGNPLKNAAKLASRVKDELGLEVQIGNADAGDLGRRPKPYHVVVDGKLVWEGGKLKQADAFEAIAAAIG